MLKRRNPPIPFRFIPSKGIQGGLRMAHDPEAAKMPISLKNILYVLLL